MASHFKIPFYIASPLTTVDFECKSGDEIIIEERSHKEVTHIGNQQIAANGISVWNPAFDVAPAELITKIITEKGVYCPSQIANLK